MNSNQWNNISKRVLLMPPQFLLQLPPQPHENFSQVLVRSFFLLLLSQLFFHGSIYSIFNIFMVQYIHEILFKKY